MGRSFDKKSALFLKRTRSYLLTSAAVAVFCVAVPVTGLTNEWTGAVDNNFFNENNWSDGQLPNGTGSSVNAGNPVGTIDLNSPNYHSNFVDQIGATSGADASVTLNVITIPDVNWNYVGLYSGSELQVGANGGQGTLTISTDGPLQTSFFANAISIGKGQGSVGEVNLIGTGKDTNVAPEGPLEMGSSCYSCAPLFVSQSSSGVRIGIDGGAGTMNLEGAVFALPYRGEFIVGDGAGSNGTLNVLAGGKLGDNYGYNSDPNVLTRGKATVGNDGGAGTINIDGAGIAGRNDAPIALFGKGLVIGNGTDAATGKASVGAVNLLASGKVNSYINYDIGQAYQNYATRADLDTAVGVNGGTGSITVTGEGAVWYQSGVMQNYLYPYDDSVVATDAGTLRVGKSGSGEITIGEGGEVRVGTASFLAEARQDDDNNSHEYYSLIDHLPNGTLVLGEQAGSSGTLSIGGATGQGATASGRLMAQKVEMGAGEAFLRFNHTDLNYVFDQFDAQYLDGPSRLSTLSIIGAGTLDAVAGRTIFNEDQLSFTGMLLSSSGIMQVNGDISSATANILGGGTLEGTGTVGTTINSGIIAPGRTPENSQGLASSIGALTVSGDYIGNDGLLLIDAVLNGDDSPTDKLVITGDTSGSTNVVVTNIDGVGAQTVGGIKIVEVGGTSDGIFNLQGDYVHDGQQAVVAGAYAYKLYQGGVSDTADGDWYLRSQLKAVDPVDPDPLYQAGAPVYEAYPQALLGLNGVSTLQQRTGNRVWMGTGNRIVAQGADSIGSPYAASDETGVAINGSGVWGRIEGAHNHIEPHFSTSDTNYSQNILKMQAGIDGALKETENGKLIGGFTVHYAHGKTKANSAHGDGDISTDGYGFGGTLTWYGENGFYLDGQGQVTWYRSDLNSTTGQTTLTDGNHGFGYALSLEGGKRFAINEAWSLTPQAQLTYSNVDFDTFTDVFGADVSLDRGESLQGRVGLTLDHENSWQNSNGLLDRTRVYGIANLYYEFLDGSRVNVAETSFTSRNDRAWGGLGLGGSYNWNDDKYSIYGEGLVNTSLNNFGDSYSIKGNVGFRMKW